MEIRSYSLQHERWEWNGDGWEETGEVTAALEAGRSSDLSAYADGERCLLRAFDDVGNQLGELEFVVESLSACDRCGADGLRLGDLTTLRNGLRICPRCEHDQ